MQNKDHSVAGQLKKLVTGLDSNRKNIQGKSDVSGNITQAKETFNQFEGVIKGQTSTINSLKAFQKSMSSQNARNLQVKRFFFSFAEKMKTQISKFLKIGQNVFTMSAQKNNKQEEYEKVVAQLLKLINSIKQQSENPQKMYAGVYKLLAIRDNIICQVFRVMLYKKNILWRDLNIKFDDYIHGEVKSALLKIKENEQKYGYVPTSLHFRMPKIQTQAQSSLQDLITIVFQDHGQLIESMKNFSKLSQEPQLIQDISKNQHIVKGLRQKIQILTRNYNTLMEKYRGLQISKGKAQMGQNQQKSLNEKIEDLESSLIKKDQEIIELKQAAMKSDSAIQGLKDKNKQLQDQISKWQNFQLPKIKELELGQKTLLEQFTKTKKDFETYSGLYQSQREDKIKAYSDLKDERSRLNQMANILGRERRKIKQLKAELLRKDQIIMQLVEKAPDP